MNITVNEDEELKKLAEEERVTYKNKLIQVDNDLINLVLEYLNHDKSSDIILDINAGVGGQESMLFVKDLLDMYLKHTSYLGYNSEIIHLDENSIGGIRYASVMISGKYCFQKLIHEAGVHRVQRVPATEKGGRIHTSVVSVAVLPQASDIQVILNPADLKIDTMRASGAGGQHVNTTDSAVRITHLPTKIVSECQVHRSQIKNRELALLKLRTKIYDQQLEKEQQSITFMRKQQMGRRERNEKIRTYNFIQDRITDHRLSNGTLHNLKGFLSGGKTLDDLHARLEQQSKLKLFLELVKTRN
jgi:peptide chain release factor 1